MKKLISCILVCLSVLLFLSFATAEGSEYVDDLFLQDFSASLNARWKVAGDSLNKSKGISLVNIELDYLKKYYSSSFEDQKLRNYARAYIKALDSQLQGMSTYYGSNDTLYNYYWTTNGYNVRAYIIYCIDSEYGLDIQPMNYSSYSQLLSAGIENLYVNYGWTTKNGRKQFVDGTRQVAKGITTIDKKPYYFDQNGFMLTNGFISYNHKMYYAQADGQLLTGWQVLNGVQYYFTRRGAMAVGPTEIAGAVYYFNESGMLSSGWNKYGEKWYYVQPTGLASIGWQNIGGVWYYFLSSGEMATGWIFDGTVKYYFDGSGAMQTGWIQSGNSWYYLEPSGAMAKGWKELKEGRNKVWYYFQDDGAMATGWLQINGQWEFFANNGSWQYTWTGN